MFKIEQNNETERFIRESIQSCNEYFNFGNIIHKTHRLKINKQMERELVELYNQYGVHIETLRQDVSELLENPYYKNIKLSNVKSENIQYKVNRLPKRTLLGMGFTKYADKLFKGYIDMGYFDKDVDIPVLFEGKTTWMSPTLSETRSIQPHIDRAHGDILTFGLGIGYYVYMCSLKKEVTSITVVEKNTTIIELFNKFIRPQFNSGIKINIIHGDMYDYYNRDFLNKFNTVFVDVWENNTDGLEHYKKLMSTGIIDDKISYWIEESIIEDIRLYMLTYIKAIYSNDYMNAINIIAGNRKNNIKAIHKYFMNINKTVTTYEELVDLINNKEQIRKIAGSMN